jgi:hypothetical protein
MRGEQGNWGTPRNSLISRQKLSDEARQASVISMQESSVTNVFTNPIIIVIPSHHADAHKRRPLFSLLWDFPLSCIIASLHQ